MEAQNNDQCKTNKQLTKEKKASQAREKKDEKARAKPLQKQELEVGQKL